MKVKKVKEILPKVKGGNFLKVKVFETLQGESEIAKVKVICGEILACPRTISNSPPWGSRLRAPASLCSAPW